MLSPQRAVAKQYLRKDFTQFGDLAWSLKATKVDESQKLGYTGKGVKIAIIDSGVRTDVFRNLNVVSQVDCLQLKKNEKGTMTCSPLQNITSLHRHGTIVTSIITGKPNPSTGFNGGVAPDALIFSARVLDENNEHQEKFNYEKTSVYYAIQWAIQQKVHIINISLSMSKMTDSEKEIIRKAKDDGIIIVASSGNYGTSRPEKIEFPARMEEVIAVGAIEKTGRRSSHFYENKESSQYGNELNLVAPGTNVAVLDPDHTQRGRIGWGTSYASPIVSGIAALYMQMHKELGKELTGTNIEVTLKQNALYIPSEAKGFSPIPFWNEEYGHGLIQAPTPTLLPVHTKLTLLNAFQGRLKPGVDEPVVMTFRPITIKATEKLEDWYKVETDMGALWTKSEQIIEGAFKIKTSEGAAPFEVNHLVISNDSRWFRVQMDEKMQWINPKRAIMDEKDYFSVFFAPGVVNSYDVPGGEPVGYIFGMYPTISKAFGYHKSEITQWIKIKTNEYTYKWIIANPVLK